MPRSELALKGIRLLIRLGCSEDEREKPQPVEVDVRIGFDAPPRGTVTDRLEDTVCYSVLVDAIKNSVGDREFSLVEHLGSEIFNALRRIVDPAHTLQVAVLKVSPPIPELTRGAEFTLSD